MRKNKYDELDQKIRSLRKRRGEIWDAQRNDCWVELEEPEKHGWYIRMVMRSDIARRADADSIQEVIDLVERRIWVSQKVTGRRVKGKYCKYTKRHNWEEYFPWKSYYFEHHNHYGVSYWYYENHLSDQAKKWFDVPKQLDYWGRGFCPCNIPDWFWERKFERCWATHYQELDSELISEEKWIDNKLWGNYYDDAQRTDWRTYPKRNPYTSRQRANSKQVLRKMKQYGWDDSVAEFNDKYDNKWDWD